MRYLSRINLLLMFLLVSGVQWSHASENCDPRNFDRLSSPGLLPIPKDPVASLRDNHWSLFGEIEGIRSPELQADLVNAFNRVFTEHGNKPSAARVSIKGLKSFTPKSDVNLAEGLSPKTLEVIDTWAQKCLKITKEATGEDLEIRSIVVGRGHHVGNDEGSLIHSDTAGTYLHALTTLNGPTTFVFPNSPELAKHHLMSIDDKGVMTVRKVTPRDEESAPPFQINQGGHTKLGETVIFGGGDYVTSKPGRQAIQHASPPSADLNRLTLFISIQPKK